MTIKRFYIYVRVEGINNIYVLREIIMNTPVCPKLRNKSENLNTESELDDLIESIKRICFDLRWNGMLLIFGIPYKDYRKGFTWVNSISEALGEKTENIELGIRNLSQEEKNVVIEDVFSYAQEQGLFLCISEQK